MTKEKPIIFNSEMVRAILEGRKTQTRREVKGLEEFVLETCKNAPKILGEEGEKALNCLKSSLRCPYGKVGDKLRVKETHYLWGHWIKNGLSKSGKQKWKFKCLNQNHAMYLISNEGFESQPAILPKNRQEIGWHKRPAIFMPSWASRITLEITNIRVERLADISEKDALAEGIYKVGNIYEASPKTSMAPDAKTAFAYLWESIKGKESWNRNPFCWVLEFKRVEA